VVLRGESISSLLRLLSFREIAELWPGYGGCSGLEFRQKEELSQAA
jgi:hypothetical protein